MPSRAPSAAPAATGERTTRAQPPNPQSAIAVASSSAESSPEPLSTTTTRQSASISPSSDLTHAKVRSGVW